MPYVNAILEAGIVEQNAPVEVFNLKEMIRFKNDSKEIDIVALPNEDYRLTVLVDYANPSLGSQHTGIFDFKNEFVNEFASARTFCFLTELQMLHKSGLIKGGSLESGVVIEDKPISEDELNEIKDIFGLNVAPVKGDNGILNNTELRYRNEPARHKLLDMIGDLTLVGVRINAQVLAARPGHASNIEVAKKIREQYLKYKDSEKLTPNVENYYDIQQILEILPHRYPFLLVDRVIKFDEESLELVAIKNVTVNEPFFPGHFPGKPIMPGVLILEAMAQVGGILIYISQDKKITEGKKAFFMSVNNAKFRKPIIPGDQIVMKVKLVQKKLGAFKFEATANVDDHIVAQAELQAALVEG
jgi:UDP-3-O-[3-hydroxymyristoyl] N-acetylglucosamine deacetylase/3-hydroxyacyl-[acyl-carrier-protein] dehydratase